MCNTLTPQARQKLDTLQRELNTLRAGMRLPATASRPPTMPQAPGLALGLPALPQKRTAGQELEHLRREFGDERTMCEERWDELPDPLQRSWARAKRTVGQPLSEREKRALYPLPQRQRFMGVSHG